MLKFETDDPLIDKIEEELKTGNLSQSQLSYMNLAAGKVFADNGDHQKAFDHYTKANKFANRSFNSSGFELEVKDSLYVFSQEFVDQLNGLGSSSEQPVFIVGMPRSGSTLVEQILASHSKVYGAGELGDIKSIATEAAKLVKGNISYPHYLPLLQDNHFGKIADAYLKRINSVAGGDYERIINKHPLNFKHLGLIVAMFPNVKIIHTRRVALHFLVHCDSELQFYEQRQGS